jgi:UDP-N-acetylglucosamine:LPS N-acetylglucosamine transferase
MDLMKLGKKSILVPTPGQAEQEYLATHLHQQQLAYTVLQSHFSLTEALTKARAFSYQLAEISMEEYKKSIREKIKSLREVDL